MKRKSSFCIAICALFAFVLWTLLLRFVDVQAIGPQNSKVGFASVNGFFHTLTGVNMRLYVITDWLGLVPIFIALAFALLGLVQWICRKSIAKVDYNLFVLGAFYIIVFLVYLLFEYVVINRRPTLIDGYLEVSYPSSTTMLVLCVIPTAMSQLRQRLKKSVFKTALLWVMVAFTLFMVIGRLLSGVHWLSDIIGGALISTALVAFYHAFCKRNALRSAK